MKLYENHLEQPTKQQVKDAVLRYVRKEHVELPVKCFAGNKYILVEGLAELEAARQLDIRPKFRVVKDDLENDLPLREKVLEELEYWNWQEDPVFGRYPDKCLRGEFDVDVAF